MSDTTIGNEAGQEQASSTERISSETTPDNSGGQEQSSNSQAQPTNTTNNSANTQNNTTEIDKRVSEANREAANYRKQLRELESQREEANKTLSTITAERDQLRAELRDIKVTREVEKIVSAAQPHNLNDVMRLINLSSVKVDGRTGQVDEQAIISQLQLLQSGSSYLFKTGNLGADAGAGAGNNQASIGMNQLIRNTIQNQGV